jgi:hypothetical protein
MKLDMAHENAKRISDALQTPGGHLSIGRGGYTLYFNGSSRLQGYDCDQTWRSRDRWLQLAGRPMSHRGERFPARRFKSWLTHIAQLVPKSSTCPKSAFWNPMLRALNTKP